MHVWYAIKNWKKSINNPEKFWAEKADTFTWKKKWNEVLSWDFEEPKVEWFKNAQLNITENCLDRHLQTKGDQTAITWIANDPKETNINLTYKELYVQVCKFANVLNL